MILSDTLTIYDYNTRYTPVAGGLGAVITRLVKQLLV